MLATQAEREAYWAMQEELEKVSPKFPKGTRMVWKESGELAYVKLDNKEFGEWYREYGYEVKSKTETKNVWFKKNKKDKLLDPVGLDDEPGLELKYDLS